MTEEQKVRMRRTADLIHEIHEAHINFVEVAANHNPDSPEYRAADERYQEAAGRFIAFSRPSPRG